MFGTFFFFFWFWGLNPGHLHPGPFLFIYLFIYFCFETGSCYVAEGLAQLLRLALNLWSSCLPSTEIKGLHHHARLQSDFLFFGTGDWTQGRSTSALHPRPYFLYFILKPGLTKLQRASLRRERERERDRKRAKELRLATNPDPPVSASQSTGITSVRHHARHHYLFFKKENNINNWKTYMLHCYKRLTTQLCEYTNAIALHTLKITHQLLCVCMFVLLWTSLWCIITNKSILKLINFMLYEFTSIKNAENRKERKNVY